jgi:hypothetical protein
MPRKLHGSTDHSLRTRMFPAVQEPVYASESIVFALYLAVRAVITSFGEDVDGICDIPYFGADGGLHGFGGAGRILVNVPSMFRQCSKTKASDPRRMRKSAKAL